MAIYTVQRPSSALSTTADTLTITASTTKPLRVLIVDIKGMGTSSVANEIGLYRSTTGSGPAGALTPVPINSNSSAASFTVYTGWTTQPSLGVKLWEFGVNANGGIDKFVAIPGAEFQVPVAGVISLRSISGTSNMVVTLMIDEID
jgi:hypothetical protein